MAFEMETKFKKEDQTKLHNTNFCKYKNGEKNSWRTCVPQVIFTYIVWCVYILQNTEIVGGHVQPVGPNQPTNTVQYSQEFVPRVQNIERVQVQQNVDSKPSQVGQATAIQLILPTNIGSSIPSSTSSVGMNFLCNCYWCYMFNCSSVKSYAQFYVFGLDCMTYIYVSYRIVHRFPRYCVFQMTITP